MVADDDQDLLALLKSILENKDFITETALNAEEAFGKYEQSYFDVVVLDINMPGTTGIELAERIRQYDEDVQIIIMTAYSDVDFAVEAIRFQVFEYVIKPFRVEDLVRNIEKAAEKSVLIRRNKEILEKYQLLFQSFPDGILELNATGKVLFHNPAALEVFGLGNHGTNVTDFLIANPQIDAALKRVRRSGKDRLEEVKIDLSKANGASRTIQVSLNTLKKTNGRWASYLAILRDITERKSYEDEIIAAKKRFQSIFDAITDRIVLIDQRYNVVAANHYTHTISGLSSEEILKLKCNDLICQQPEVCCDCPVQATFDTGQPAFKSLSNTGKPDGHGSHYELYTYPLRESDGNVVEVILYAKDVTRSKELQYEIAQSEKMASIGELAAGLAHELKNPLAIISASAQFCLERLQLDETVQEHLSVIFRNIQNANKIVSDLLNYARPSQMLIDTLDLNEVIHRALKLLHTKLKKSEIRLRKNLAQEIPRLIGDAQSLEQVFVNILLNSIQAIGRSGRITIRTTFESMSGNVVIVLKDNGPGIPKNKIGKIFDPFFTTKSGGTGLGLSICHRIILNHQGTIRVNSKPNKGTEFIIELPTYFQPKLS